MVFERFVDATVGIQHIGPGALVDQYEGGWFAIGKSIDRVVKFSQFNPGYIFEVNDGPSAGRVRTSIFPKKRY